MSVNTIEKVVAVVLVGVALLFVAYNEVSLTGAGFTANTGYANCYDSDPTNDVTVRGTVTYQRLNVKTRVYEPMEPKVDQCIGSARVQEWSCTSYHKPKEVSRRTYCPKGTVCRIGAGACVPN